MQRVANAHALDNYGRDALGIHQILEGRDILGQEVLMDAAKGREKRSECSACSFTTVAMGFPASIAIIILRPLALAVANGRVSRMEPGVVRALAG